MPQKDPEVRAAYQREYQRAYREKHREKLNATSAAWALANADLVKARREASREVAAAVTAAWRAANPERVAQANREWYEAYRDKAREYQAAYRPKNRERHKVHNHRRRKQIAKGDLTPAQWQDILIEFDNRCAYCQVGGALELEHMTPLSRGGLHTASNVVPACRDCNSRNRTRTIFEFLAVA